MKPTHMDKHAPKSVSSPTLDHAAPTRQFSIMAPHWLAQHSASMDPVSTQQALTLFIAELTSYQPFFENTHYTTTELRALCLILKGSADSFGAYRLHAAATQVHAHLDSGHLHSEILQLKEALRETIKCYKSVVEVRT
ncbi:hypothetical protein [Vibrio coralliilyticus]|uniref:hypothetical protein n=1 Tax=Vibrio coralliilyticus TaxID=190893 RepID=UPI00117F63D7|nr:hypothetical protein [Vibrio coralliilyticus]